MAFTHVSSAKTIADSYLIKKVVDHYELTLAGLANSLLIPTLEGGFLDVVVTYIDRDLGIIYAVLADKMNFIIQMEKQTIIGNDHLYNPVHGKIGIARIGDGYRRAFVLKRTDPASVQVCLIDNGMTKKINLFELAVLSNKLAEIPPMAFAIVLSSFDLKNATKVQLDEIEKLLINRFITLKIDRVLSNVISAQLFIFDSQHKAIELATALGTACLNLKPTIGFDAKIDDDKASSYQHELAEPTAHVPCPQPIIDLKPELLRTIIRLPSLLSQPVVHLPCPTTEPIVVSVEIGMSDWQTSAVDDQQQLVETNIAFGTREDLPLPLMGHCIRSDGDISSPTDFHIQIDKDIPLLAVIGQIKTPHNVLSNPAVGAIGLAMFEDEWNRVEILRVINDRVLLRFVDFGNIVEYNTNQVYTLEEQDRALIELAPCCVPCTMNGSEPWIDGNWTDVECQMFIRMFNADTYCTFNMISKNPDGKYVCIIYSNSDKTLAQAIKGIDTMTNGCVATNY